MSGTLLQYPAPGIPEPHALLAQYPRGTTAQLCDFRHLNGAPNGQLEKAGDLIKSNLLRSLPSLQDFGSDTLVEISPRQSQVLPVFDWKLLPQGLGQRRIQNLSRRHGHWPAWPPAAASWASAAVCASSAFCTSAAFSASAA